MDEKQMTKGREAYRMMDEACNQLVQSGNWQRVGSSDIKLFLDMYVQALLLKMAQTTGEISGDMLTYIARVPARDILKIGQAAPQQALNIGFKNRSFAEGTPLLLRCCVAMDDKDGTATAQQFVDGVSRLLYAAADVDGVRNVTEKPVLDLSKLKTLKDGTLTVGVEVGYPPMEDTDDAGLEYQGFDIDFAKALGEVLGVDIEFVNTAWDGIFAGLDKEQYDVIISSVSITPERQAAYDLTEPYVSNQLVIVTLK